jgi:hypothetical protein
VGTGGSHTAYTDPDQALRREAPHAAVACVNEESHPGAPNTVPEQAPPGGTWDAFNVYKNGGLIATLTASDPNLGVSGPEYCYTVPAPITNATLGVSTVSNGAESPISYADGTYSC